MVRIEDLPEFNEHYIQYFDPYLQSFQVRRKSRADGNISLTESMELIDAYLQKYQLTYVCNKIDKNMVLFPFLFSPPSKGDKILNTDTKETYEVDQIINDPETGDWHGLVKLNLRNAPSMEEGHALKMILPRKLVSFNHEVPDSLPNPLGANLEKLLQQPPPMLPTITWKINSVEPGILGSISSSKRERKPRLRETFKDPLVPGHTVEVFGQLFDNIVQFDCWSNDPRTSDRLASWFGQFMRLYVGDLRKDGLNQILFLKRTPDETNQTWRQAYSVKSLQYRLITEEIDAQYTRDILKIDISITTSQTPPSNRRFNEPRWIGDQLVTGNITSDQYRSLFYRSGEYLFGDIDIRQ